MILFACVGYAEEPAEKKSELQVMPDIMFTEESSGVHKWRDSVRPIIPVDDLDIILVIVITGPDGEETLLVSQVVEAPSETDPFAPITLTGYQVYHVASKDGFKGATMRGSEIVERQALKSLIVGLREDVVTAERDTLHDRFHLGINQFWFIAANAILEGSGCRANTPAHCAQALNPDPGGRLHSMRKELLAFVRVDGRGSPEEGE